MFFYLSFLRPPPIRAPLHGPISITPQISNDLRTEPFEGEQDLYYSWVLDSSSQSHTSTKPTKLTTWRPSSAYKEIPVPIPPNVRQGQEWKLVLTCQPQRYGNANPECIDLRNSNIGSIPFPVTSMSVSFNSKTMGVKNSGKEKQEMIERNYLLPFTTQSQDQDIERTVALRFIEKTSYDLDKKIWDSGIGLSSWICELKENDSFVEGPDNLSKLWSTLFSDGHCKIVELGAGIGLVSVALAVLRSGTSISTSNPLDGDVILATDVHAAMPLLQQNISANAHYCRSVAPQALVLDWDDEVLPPEMCDLGGLDIIVMADVSYNTSSFPALSRTLSGLVRLGSKSPIIILGYKERDEAERTFWDMTAQIGIHFEKAGERKGNGGAPVEVWLGSYSSSNLDQ